jgi:serine/threonine-protein kinase
VLNVLLYVLLAAVLLGGAYLGIRALVDSASQDGLKMQNFVGMDINVAKQQLDNAGILYDVQPKVSDAAKDTVISQDPKAGEYLPPGVKLLLTVSSGRQQAEVPDLTGMNYNDAETLLRSKSLDVGDARYEDSDMPKDTVVRQDPPALSSLEIGGKVNIWLARPSESSVQQMPDVFGLTKDEAVSRIVARNVDSSKIKVILRPSNFAAGIVDGQQPSADTALDAATEVTLYVSNGVPPGYIKNYEASFDISTDKTDVKVVLIDGDETNTVYENTYNAGTHRETILLQSMTLGQKTLKIYFNGVKVKEETITFEAKDAAGTSPP